MKFYAVAKGRKTGIFTTWPQAEQQVKGFAGAKYKSFKTRAAAQAFLENPVYKTSSASKTASGRTRTAPKAHEAEPADAVVVYTDGGAIGNPGPGGYGVVFEDGRQFSGGFAPTTNNRMELMAVIVALEALGKETRPILIYSDSRYVINGISKGWAASWKKRGWKKSDGKPALNPDLWQRLLDLVTNLDVRFRWVKGHAGNPMNEACDHLANSTARQGGLPQDPGYSPAG